ncbi:hypothetical protein ACP275_13G201300 [Erythranthe tilingii]
MSSDEMQNFSGTWEHEFYQLHQPSIVYRTSFSDDDQNKLLIPGDHLRTSTPNAAVNVSGPESGANPIINGKPLNKRRRSTAGTSSPTTFLNASITNFRALVQQHTSRSGGGNNGSTSTASRKGPITLCFDSSLSISSTVNHHHHHHHHEPNSFMPNISSTQAHHQNYYPF